MVPYFTMWSEVKVQCPSFLANEFLIWLKKHNKQMSIKYDCWKKYDRKTMTWYFINHFMNKSFLISTSIQFPCMKRRDRPHLDTKCEWHRSGYYCYVLYAWGPFHQHGLTLISAWIGNYIHYKMWDEITYPIPKLQRLHCWSLGMG